MFWLKQKLEEKNVFQAATGSQGELYFQFTVKEFLPSILTAEGIFRCQLSRKHPLEISYPQLYLPLLGVKFTPIFHPIYKLLQ